MATKRGKNKANLQRRKRVGAPMLLSTRKTMEKAYEAFHEDGDAKQALTLMQQIEAHGHISIDAIRLYLDILQQVRDFSQYARVATIFAERCPEDPTANLSAAAGAFASMQPISAILYFERFLKLAPNHQEAKSAAETLQKLRSNLPQILDAFLDDLPKDLPRIASVEKILHVFQLGRFDDVVQRAEKHLQAYPNDIRIRNNFAEGLAYKGDAKRALKVIDETLEMAPKNFFARAVRCRLAYFQGQMEASKADAEELRVLQPKQISDLGKAAQSFAYIADYEGIRWAYEEAEKRKWLDGFPSDVAVLTNLFATLLARTGDVESAKTLWSKAVKLVGEATTANENLDDLRRRPGEQSGPAFFGIGDWLSPSQMDEIRDWVMSSQNSDDDAIQSDRSLRQVVSRLLQRYPEVERSIPAMLDCGDADSQMFALSLARGSRHPDVKAALSNYLSGSRGTDEMRQRSMMILKELGHTFDSPLSIYSQGKVHQIEVVSFQITDEPEIAEERSAEAQDLLEAAFDALNEGDGAEAEKLLRQVLKIESNQPDVLNNLGMALQIQGRIAEADSLVDEIVEKHPEYFFAKIALANRNSLQKKYDEAYEILCTLHGQKSLHVTEFYALAKAMILALVGKKEFPSAQYWLDMLREYDPDHPEISELQDFIASKQKPSGLLKKLYSN